LGGAIKTYRAVLIQIREAPYIEAARSCGASSANSNGALYEGLYYWVLEPAVPLMFAGLAFALLGFALDRILNPTLRGL